MVRNFRGRILESSVGIFPFLSLLAMVLRDNPFSCHIDIVFRIFVSENTQVLGKLYAQEASVVWNGK